MCLILVIAALGTRLGTVDETIEGSRVRSVVGLWQVCTTVTTCSDVSDGQCATVSDCVDPAAFACSSESGHFSAARAALIVAGLFLIPAIVIAALDARRWLPDSLCDFIQLRKLVALLNAVATLVAFVAFALLLATWFRKHCDSRATSQIAGSHVGPSPFLALAGSLLSFAAALLAMLLRTRMEKAADRLRVSATLNARGVDYNGREEHEAEPPEELRGYAIADRSQRDLPVPDSAFFAETSDDKEGAVRVSFAPNVAASRYECGRADATFGYTISSRRSISPAAAAAAADIASSSEGAPERPDGEVSPSPSSRHAAGVRGAAKNEDGPSAYAVVE